MRWSAAAQVDLYRLVSALVRRRNELGLSQVQVGERMGIQGPAVCKIELGTDQRLSTIVRYAEAVGARITATIDPLPDGRHAASTPLTGTPGDWWTGQQHTPAHRTGPMTTYPTTEKPQVARAVCMTHGVMTGSDSDIRG